MSVLIDDEAISRIEILSKLELDEKEKELAKEDMQKMLTYFDKLKEADTGEVSPLVHPGAAKGCLRKDEVTNKDQKESILANAPKAKEDLFVVPRTI